MTTNTQATDKISALNDMLRQSMLTGQVELSRGIQALSLEKQKQVLAGVKNYNSFAPQGDSQKEKDFGAFPCGDHDIFWVIDCHNGEGVFTCTDTDNPSKTNRILKIMLVDEVDY